MENHTDEGVAQLRDWSSTLMDGRVCVLGSSDTARTSGPEHGSGRVVTLLGSLEAHVA
jgi:hypothetical protein